MNYSSSYQDVFYAFTGDTLDYGLYLGTIPLFFGRCVKRPGAASANININKICQDSLDAGFPFSNESGLTFGEFSLYRMVDGEPFELLGEYGLLLSFDRDYSFNGQSDFLSDPINGRADSRMKMVYSVFMDTTGQTVCEEQALHKRITIHPNTLNVGSGATAVTLTIEANYEYEVYVDGSPDWVTLSQSSGASGTTVITVTVTENPLYEDRNAMIYVDEYQIPVIQAQRPFIPVFIVTPSEISLGAASGTSSITVSANTDYRITQIPDWIHFDTVTGASGETVFSFTYDATTLQNARTAEIRVQTEYVSVTQEGLYINVNPQTLNFEYDGDTVTLAISANTDYQISTSLDWITLSQSSGSSGQTAIYVTASYNTGGNRSGVVFVGNTAVNVAQGSYSGYLEFSPASITSDYNGGQFTVTISANSSYVISTDDPWVTLSTNSGSAGETVLTVTLPTNYGAARNSTVYIGNKALHISQAAFSSYISVSPQTITAPGTGGTFTLTVSSNTDFNITEDSPWISLSQTSGSAGQTIITVTIDSNEGSARSAEINVGGQIVTVSQIANTDFIYVYPTAITAYTADTYAITITANTTYSITTDAPWLTLSQSTGYSGITTLNVTVDYDSGQTRQGTIYIGTEQVKVYHMNAMYGEYLTLENIGNSSGVLTLENPSSFMGDTLYFSVNDGEWVKYSNASQAQRTVPVGGKVYLRNEVSGSMDIPRNTIGLTGTTFNAYGNAMSLIYGANFAGKDYMTTKYSATFSRLFAHTDVVSAAGLVLPPPNEIGVSCFEGMFSGCTSLVSAPQLPYTNLDEECYGAMFFACESLVNAPALPATTIADWAYGYMFGRCTSLVTAPALPATNLGNACYQYMFTDCTSLVNAPALPATTLSQSAYTYMFYGCTSLVNAPDLPAQTVPARAYYRMFYECTSLNNLKCLATQIGTNATTEWLYNVASGGTFTKASGMTWSGGSSGVPYSWTIVDA